MNRTRWVGIAAVVVCIALAGAAYGLTGRSTEAVAQVPPSSSTTADRSSTTVERSTTTTTEAPTTTTTVEVEAKPEGLAPGAESEEVAVLQRRLTELRFDPGTPDGVYGQGTVFAVQAFQKLNGLEPTGQVGPATEAALADPTTPTPQVPDGGDNRVEIDLPRQLLFLYKGGDLRLITHISSGNNERYCAPGGCGTAVTPVGAHRFMWRYPGWRTSRLGKLYNPVYFTGGGIAIHGASSVPTYPASHGCVRIPMHIAEYFPSLVSKGDAVYVLDGKTDVGPAPALTADLPPPPADPPTTPDTAPETTITTVPETVITLPPTTTTTPASTEARTAEEEAADAARAEELRRQFSSD
jgi:peptidoglycan hydrolase-like protein with peptidoglycan-binding domain